MKSTSNKILLVSLMLFLVALSATPSRSDSGGIPNENAKGYWTKERMANAIAIELVVDEKTGIGKIQPAAAKNSGSTSTSTTISTSDWPQGNPIAQTAVGKVFFSDGISNYVCSGSLINETDTTRAIVLTAGHCVWDQAKSKYFSNWAFVPDYDSNRNNPIYYSRAIIVQDEFSAQTTFNSTALQNDWAFAILDDSDQLRNMNSYPLAVNAFSAGAFSVALGYPQARPFNGLYLKYAGAPVFLDSKNSNLTIGMSNSMTGGSSGGPWLSSTICVDLVLTKRALCYGLSGSVSSLNSYKYGNDNTKMYGPIFNSKTRVLLATALTK